MRQVRKIEEGSQWEWWEWCCKSVTADDDDDDDDDDADNIWQLRGWKTTIFIPLYISSTKWGDLCSLKKMSFRDHFLVKSEGCELAFFFSSKHIWHSLNKHIVGFQVVFQNQWSFFSETSIFVESNQLSKFEQVLYGII